MSDKLVEIVEEHLQHPHGCGDDSHDGFFVPAGCVESVARDIVRDILLIQTVKEMT